MMHHRDAEDMQMTRSNDTTDVLLVSPKEAQRLLSVGNSTFYKLVRSGELPSLKLGKARRVPLAAIKGLVERLAEGQGKRRRGRPRLPKYPAAAQPEAVSL